LGKPITEFAVALSSDLIGVWSQKHGYETDPEFDWRIEFHSDSTGRFLDPEETVSFWWELSDESRLQTFPLGQSAGVARPILTVPARSAQIEIRRETLPLGEFNVLRIDGLIFPTGCGRFTKIDNPDSFPYRPLMSRE
jgi:hypothetical protein